MNVHHTITSERLHQATGHQSQITASVLLAIAGFAALIPGFSAIARRITSRGPRLASVGAALNLAGCVGFAVLASIDGIPTIAATHVPSTGVMADYLHQLDNSPALAVLGPVALLGFFAGPFLVALAARRAGMISRWLTPV